MTQNWQTLPRKRDWGRADEKKNPAGRHPGQTLCGDKPAKTLLARQRYLCGNALPLSFARLANAHSPGARVRCEQTTGQRGQRGDSLFRNLVGKCSSCWKQLCFLSHATISFARAASSLMAQFLAFANTTVKRWLPGRNALVRAYVPSPARDGQECSTPGM
jgi:hypothetical protein